MMYIWIILLLSDIPVFGILPKDTFGKHIKKYEIVDCYVTQHKELRTKRNLHVNNKTSKYFFAAEVRFKSYQTDFHLLLTEDTAFRNIKVGYHSERNISSDRVKSKIYDGVLKAEPDVSHAFGYLENGAFTGYIALRDEVYFAEPAGRFFPNQTRNGKIIVYREQDIDIPQDTSLKEEEGLSSILSRFNKVYGKSMADILPKGIDKSKKNNEDYACAIEIVSDHTLYDYFKGKGDILTAYLYLHGKYADFIFRRADFDGDGKRDQIRIITEKIFIYKSINDPDYPMAKADDMVSFLKAFSLRTQNFCLSLCMTNKYSQNMIIGEAFKSTTNTGGPPGGICQKPISFSNLFKSINRSLNTAVVTIKSNNDIAYPLAVTLLAVAHEFGHSFGSSHDRLEDISCSPGGSKGFYLMHPKSPRVLKPLNTFFSHCSRKSIADVISARGECLKPHPATCGNGVQEGNEECDCGNEATCWFLDKCCTPSDAKSPEKGCTFRKSKGYACSPKEDLCCLKHCVVNQDIKFLCIDNEDDSCLVSNCDGQNATCPKPRVANDKHPCERTSKSCSKGRCNSSACLDNGLDDCVCKDRFECSICCKKEDNCVTASSLGFFAPDGVEHFQIEGTPCHYKLYQCDGSGRCANTVGREVESTPSSIPLILAIGGLTFALLVVITVLCYLAKDHIKKFWYG